MFPRSVMRCSRFLSAVMAILCIDLSYAEVIFHDNTEKDPDRIDFLRGEVGLAQPPSECLQEDYEKIKARRDDAAAIQYLKDRAFDNEGFIKELFDQSEKLATIIGDDAAVFIGRSPSYLLETIKLRYPRKNTSLMIPMNYSGTPDAKYVRSGLPVEKIGSLNIDINFENYVSEDRLEYFCKYADSLGLKEVVGKLFIVDAIGTGGGLNSFLRLLRYYYTNRDRRLPNIYFIGLNLRTKTEPGCHWVGDKNWLYQPTKAGEGFLVLGGYERCPETGTYRFGTRRQEGWRSVEVDAIPLGMSDETMKVLDDPKFQRLASPGVHFAAYQWEPHYDQYRISSGVYWPLASQLLREALERHLLLSRP